MSTVHLTSVYIYSSLDYNSWKPYGSYVPHGTLSEEASLSEWVYRFNVIAPIPDLNLIPPLIPPPKKVVSFTRGIPRGYRGAEKQGTVFITPQKYLREILVLNPLGLGA
jgi:hypothetical protein